MRIALHTVVSASKEEPLNEMVGWVRKAFLDAGLRQPWIRFTLTDAAFGKGVSAIDRVLKRYPETERFLTRRTQQNLTMELYLDVGTWSHLVSAGYLIKGAGFQASVGVPVAPEVYGQYPIGDAEQWQKIVENLAAMVQELERSFVPAVEQAVGPSPAWYEPPS